MIETPFDKIKKILSKNIPSKLISKIPDKWEKVGDVVIIKLHDDLKKYNEIIGENYAEVLRCKTVLNDVGGISGEYREPKVEIIYGVDDTETIHKENGVQFKLDPKKIMFSSGNMDERIRMANISNKNEIVVDLFAGIGYFTLPIAVHSKPKRVYACEINPVSYDYLCQNIVLNNVVSIVEPLFGDNREAAPFGMADRVIMGYFGATIRFLPTAFKCLRNNRGVIHFHDTFPEEDVPDRAIEQINNEARKCRLNVNLLRYIKVKSFAPGIGHYVFDLEIGKNE